MVVLSFSAPTVRQEGSLIRMTTTSSEGSQLWFEVAASCRDLLSDRSDYVALATLLPAMSRGTDLHVAGTMTDALLYHVNGDLQALLTTVLPNLTTVAVSADNAEPAGDRPSGVATGFSGGVDSMTAVREFALSNHAPSSYRLTHLLNYNVGSHGSGGRALWRARLKRLEPLAVELSLPIVAVNSNLDEHYPRLGFAETVTMRNAAVAHFLSGGIGRVHHAATYSFLGGLDGRVQSTSTVEPMLLPLVSTERLIIAPAFAGSSRVDRTLALVGIHQARYLDVCISPDPTLEMNCSQCSKCVRTLVTLEIAGDVDQFFPRPFDRDRYYAARDEQLAELFSAPDPFTEEILELARDRGWDWKRRIITRSRAIRRRRRVKDLLRRVVRRLRATRARS